MALTNVRQLLVALVGVAAAILLSACGGSGRSGTAAGAAGASSARQEVRFAACVRSHGVPEYPDSGQVTDRSTNTTAGTATVSGQAVPVSVLNTAEDKCYKDAPGVAGTRPVSAAQLAGFQAKELQFSQCMRAHGISNFPDYRVVRGPDGLGDEFKVVGRAPGPYPTTAFSDATKACFHLEKGVQ